MRLHRYRILERLGAGGMGLVFRAEDLSLKRDVALKFLAGGSTGRGDRRARFLREARAAAALSHPNICTIFEVGEVEEGVVLVPDPGGDAIRGGTPFIAMELVSGETLRSRIARGPIPAGDLARIGEGIAAGLARAHRARIVHRDLKPENVMIAEDGLVKILDFGLARLIEPERGEEGEGEPETASLQVTREGQILGTAPYMSPEQARGLPADHRSDIFALGSILYEMATGRRAFTGPTMMDTLSAVISREPPPAGSLSPGVPARLEGIIERCLRKAPERRYPSADDVAADLRALRSGAPAPPGARLRPRKGGRGGRVLDSLAVLPFESAGTDPETEYLGDGITEALINHLSHLPKLRVMARSSVQRYKGRPADPQEAGRELEVKAVLSGRIAQRGASLLVGAELVEASSGWHLWGEQYDRPVADLVPLQEEMARDIAAALEKRLSGERRRRIARRQPSNSEAYLSYLQGRYHWNRRSEEEFRKAKACFESAIEKDPLFALAHAGLADVYNILGYWSVLPPKEAFSAGRAAAARALEIDERLAEGHASLGYALLFHEWDFPAAEREFRRALHLDPQYGPARHWHALLLVATGRGAEALEEITRAHEAEPLSIIIHAVIGWIQHLRGRYEEAHESYRTTVTMSPEFAIGRYLLGLNHAQMERHAEAEAEMNEASRIAGDTCMVAAGWGYVLARAGREAEARRVLENLVGRSRETHVSSYDVAVIHAALGEPDRAFELLERALVERAPLLAFARVDPRLAPLRPDPRHADLVRRVGLPA